MTSSQKIGEALLVDYCQHNDYLYRMTQADDKITLEVFKGDSLDKNDLLGSSVLTSDFKTAANLFKVSASGKKAVIGNSRGELILLTMSSFPGSVSVLILFSPVVVSKRISMPFKSDEDLVWADWHPLSPYEDSLVTLTNEGRLDILCVAKDMKSVAVEQTFYTMISQDDVSAKCVMAVMGASKLDSQLKSLRSSNIMSDFSASGWLPFTIFILSSNGDLNAICPVAPRSAVIPKYIMDAIVKEADELTKQLNPEDEAFLASLDLERGWVSNTLENTKRVVGDSLLGIVFPPKHFTHLDPAVQGPFLVSPEPQEAPSTGGKSVVASSLALMIHGGSLFAAIGFTSGRVDLCLMRLRECRPAWKLAVSRVQDPIYPSMNLLETITLGDAAALSCFSNMVPSTLMQINADGDANVFYVSVPSTVFGLQNNWSDFLNANSKEPTSAQVTSVFNTDKQVLFLKDMPNKLLIVESSKTKCINHPVTKPPAKSNLAASSTSPLKHDHRSWTDTFGDIYSDINLAASENIKNIQKKVNETTEAFISGPLKFMSSDVDAEKPDDSKEADYETFTRINHVFSVLKDEIFTKCTAVCDTLKSVIPVQEAQYKKQESMLTELLARVDRMSENQTKIISEIQALSQDRDESHESLQKSFERSRASNFDQESCIRDGFAAIMTQTMSIRAQIESRVKAKQSDSAEESAKLINLLSQLTVQKQILSSIVNAVTATEYVDNLYREESDSHEHHASELSGDDDDVEKNIDDDDAEEPADDDDVEDVDEVEGLEDFEESGTSESEDQEWSDVAAA